MFALWWDLFAMEADAATERAATRRSNNSAREGLPVITEAKFRKRYRLSHQQFLELAEEIRPHMPPVHRSDALDIETKLLVALAFYATGCYQTPVGDNRHHQFSQPTVSKCIREVTMALNTPSILNRFVNFPFRRSERDRIKQRFYTATKIPGVLGCIDGTHISIVTPWVHEEQFINRKGYHSLNELIICDADLNIMVVDSSQPGSSHDRKVWENNYLQEYLKNLVEERGEDVFLLGDVGYPLRKSMMIPILSAEPESPESYFTDLHGSARSMVERCIGVLKARFRCLLVDRKLHYAPATAAQIVNACCVLHNIAHAGSIECEPLSAQEIHRERELTARASFPAPRVSRSPCCAPPGVTRWSGAPRCISAISMGAKRCINS